VLYYHPLALLSVAESLFLVSFSIMMLAVDLPTHNRVAMELRRLKVYRDDVYRAAAFAATLVGGKTFMCFFGLGFDTEHGKGMDTSYFRAPAIRVGAAVENSLDWHSTSRQPTRRSRPSPVSGCTWLQARKFVDKGFTEGFLKILTRITGKGVWYGYLGSAVFSSMRSNNCWAAGAWLLGGYTFLVGLIAGALGFSKSRKLNRIRREVGLQFDNDAERVYESFAVDDPSRGMTREEFAAMA
ncbi:hypothetical protein FOZ63_033377, partial [Perkinsus olseni]